MTDTSKKLPSSSADAEQWHTTLAGAFGEAIGRGSDGKPDLGALKVPPVTPATSTARVDTGPAPNVRLGKTPPSR